MLLALSEERMRASGFSGRRRDGALEREMHGDAGWDEKHEMSWETHAGTRRAAQWQRLVLWVADSCGFVGDLPATGHF